MIYNIIEVDRMFNEIGMPVYIICEAVAQQELNAVIDNNNLIIYIVCDALYYDFILPF